MDLLTLGGMSTIQKTGQSHPRYRYRSHPSLEPKLGMRGIDRLSESVAGDMDDGKRGETTSAYYGVNCYNNIYKYVL